ncbi:hypothetical protein ILYODFUR_023619 [Ilyodon furcidens]|uniref:Arrestin C-terminal-like domain-containing protein n=1 Tax=Ilyodon furcidens TaxID=33524 RepID=A0ABV0UBQ8_9TELE
MILLQLPLCSFSVIQSQQVGTTEKKMGIFSKGQVHMEATVNKTAYAPGESMLILAKVNNASSRDMTPKFSLTRSVEFRAQGDRKNEEYTVQKVVDKVITSYTKQEVKCEMRVPTDEMPSIENCDIISVTHQLKACMFSLRCIWTSALPLIQRLSSHWLFHNLL